MFFLTEPFIKTICDIWTFYFKDINFILRQVTDK